ncbi:ketoacyl-ACP synthase III [Nonlabens sp. MB-3u-79]|uniref:3-oxoacyl-ACP synthase III family protein n=1 Tax=Nonlabens sp. MB-3u-79 TaxID=2058134 RepID=UPI000C314781|nr:beta-ketoacyl-ACP synthase III [Nonlabens sp. MB-3u-79]AUC80373.1 ketoacyl-ACP synthase III [Nonlabens sp. MB-3u-79]|tara:strand:+ start:28103 stop:29074 length:972 start_codon:yes stop_codon:yes gene_type:complete
MDNAYIKGTGSYAPENVVKNDFFESVGSTDAWIQKNLGIKERRISTGETTSDLAAMAGKEAIKSAGLTPQDIDLIILATATPDRLAPSCACFVQEKIEAYNAVAFDISAVCSGALFATTTAVQFIKSGMYKNVLVIGADTFSNITDWNRRDAVFFGDGAGAMVISHTHEDKGFIDFLLHTDGRGKDSWNIPAGGSLLPTSEETLKKGLQYFQMDGPAVFQTAIKVVPESIKKLLSKNKVSIDEVNYLIPHQPSVRILEEVANRISLPWEKVMTNMDRYANTSGGTIPMMLDETVKKNLLKEGDLVLFAAVGAGWTWGTALYKW